MFTETMPDSAPPAADATAPAEIDEHILTQAVPAVVPAVAVRRRFSWTIPLLLLLTLIGGALRYTALDKPPIWGDEAATYGRSAGTYEDLLDQLYDSSFPPLHYETLWWLGQGMPYWGKIVPRGAAPAGDKAAVQITTFVPTRFIVPGGIRLTPFFMRLIPAIAGTLFIPALYFLARQLFGPRVALLSAFLACFSAYLLVYSRDGKMYMPFWLMCVLNVGCLLWWLRVRRPLPWLLWIASGIAMIGWHASGFAILGINALIFFTTPRLHWRKLPTLLGLIAWPIVVLPMYGAERLRRRYPRINSIGWDRLFAWPRRAWRNFALPAVIPFAVGIIVILSTMFGPLGFYSQFDSVYRKISDDALPAIDISSLGIDWVGRYNAGREFPDYLLYTSSAYLTGWEWPRHFVKLGIDDTKNIDPRTLRLLECSTVALLALLALGLVPWRRAFAPARARLDRIRQDGCVATAYRRRRLLWAAVWLTAVPWVTYTQSNQRPGNLLDTFASVVLKEPPAVSWPRARVIPLPDNVTHRVDDAAWPHGVVDFFRGPILDFRDSVSARWSIARQSIDEIHKALPTAWTSYRAAYRTGNYSIPGITFAATIAAGLLVLTIWKWRYIGRGAMALTAVTLLLVIVGSAMVLLPRWVDNDLWMPRYLGIVLPPFLIGAAVLIARQPKRWVTVLTMGAFVVVNLSQFSARVFGHTEPPLDLMAGDLIAAQPHSIIDRAPEQPTYRAYTEFGGRSVAEPGGSALFNIAGRYYLHVLSGWKDRGREVRQGEIETELNTWRFATPAAIAKDLKRSPQIKSFVVWTSVPVGAIDQTDAIADALAGQFRRTGDQVWPVADHWRWLQHPQVRRRTYERLANPTTQPAGD